MRKNNKWTDEQIAFLVVCRAKKQTWAEISFSMEEKFGIWRNPTNIGIKYRSLFNIDYAKEYTPEQREFIVNCFLNNFTTKTIIAGYIEQFNQKINQSNIDTVVQQHLTAEKKTDAEIKTIKTKIKERKNMKNKRTIVRWTEEEDAMLLACKDRQEALALQMTGRTASAIRNRWTKLRALEKARPAKRGRMTKAELEMIRNCETVEEALALNLRKPETIKRQYAAFQQKVHGNKGRKYIPRWTKEEDYDLILNFYERSIDEARNRFNRSYGAIATRLEKLVDSTKPEHISMLMEASKEIKSRKEAQNPTPKKSRRTLRKERKKAKKEDKLKAKLRRIRGD